MGRTAMTYPADAPAPINETKLAQMGQSLNAMASDATALALQLGYDGSLTVGALEDEIRFYQRRTAEAAVELGKRMLLLKELTPHGEFQQRVELLGFSYRMAAKFMSATLKFSKGSKSEFSSLLSANGMTQTKMLELVTLDDSEIEALERGEAARGITLDDIDCMSASELKAALRKAQDAQAQKSGKAEVLVEQQAAQIDKLAGELAKLQRNPPSLPAPEFVEAQALAELHADAVQMAAHIRSELFRLCGNAFALFPPGEVSLVARRGVAASLGLVLAALHDTAADFEVSPESAAVVDVVEAQPYEAAATWAAVNAQIAAEDAAAAAAGTGGSDDLDAD